MINRIIFKKTLNLKPSEDAGQRSVNGVSSIRSEELFCLPGSFSEKPVKNGFNKSEQNSETEYHLNGIIKPIPKPKVLHVEDDANLRMLLRLLLKKDFEVTSVSAGEAAVELVSRENISFDIIFMDIDLGPGLSGIQTAMELRNLPSTKKTPIIALTGNNYHDIREECMKVGLNAYIQKPFQKADLLQTISDLKSN